MIIVVKIDVLKSKSHIVDIIEGVHELDVIRGYHALLNDTLELDRTIYSIKNMGKTRTEVYHKGFTGSYLEFVYEIFTMPKDGDDEVSEEN